MIKKKYKFISLFSGCGGFDLGLIQAGFQSIAAFDIDKTALGVHKKNIGGLTEVCDLSNGKLPIDMPKDIDVVIAGSPCQGFSTIGKRKLNDPRNQLLLIGGKIAVQCKPKVFIAENVPGVLLGKHKIYWEKLHAILHAAGYATTDVACTGTEIGLAQRRKRIFLIAWNTGKSSIDFKLPLTPGKVLEDVLRDIEPNSNHDISYLDKDSSHYKIASKIKPGQKLSNVRAGPRSVHTWHIPDVFGETTIDEREALSSVVKLRRQNRIRNFGDADPVSTELLHKKFGRSLIESLHTKKYLRQIDECHDIVGTFNGKYRRLSWNQPSYTVDTRFGDPKYFLHPNENRGFTVREAARIQGFPDNFIFDGKLAEQYRMVGNAVPPPLGKVLGNYIIDNILS